jgi:hypothetical protein
MPLTSQQAKGLASGEKQQVVAALAVQTGASASVLRTVASDDTQALQKNLAPTNPAIARAIQVGDENLPALLKTLL